MRKGQKTPEHVKRLISEVKKAKFASGEYDYIRAASSKAHLGISPTEEMKNQISETLLRRYASGELDHVRDAISEAQVGRELCDEYCNHLSVMRVGTTYIMSEEAKEHLRKPKSEEGRANIGKAARDPVRRKKISDTHIANYASGDLDWLKDIQSANAKKSVFKRLRATLKGHVLFPNGDKVFYRSSWEKRFVEGLRDVGLLPGIDFEYEPKLFDLGSISYIPDYYFSKYDFYLEIKGFFTPRCIKQGTEFKKQISTRFIVLSSLSEIDSFIETLGDIKSGELLERPTSLGIGDYFLTIFRDHNSDNQQPSQVRNDLEGSETREESTVI